MQIEPGAEKLIKQMGRKMKIKARSKILERAISHIRETQHPSEVIKWFTERRFACARRTTVRLSQENISYLDTICGICEISRPALLLDIVYLAASVMKVEDFEAA